MARCVVVGDGALRSKVEALVRAQGIEERVTFLGWRRDVASLLKTFDVFVLTSHWEGLPCVLLEARASRIPVVATRVGGAAEAIAEPAQGTLYPPGEVQAMADRICQVLEDEPYRRDLLMGSEDFPEEFTIQETVKQYQSLYTCLTHAARSTRDVMRLETNRPGG
jgi:glycosyltransferase involved in cell wall biosynthesis